MKKIELLMDFYELTMSNCYFVDKKTKEIAVFDVYFRSVPDEGGYAVFAGLQQIIDFITNFNIDEDEISFLKNKGCFHHDFLEYLKNLKFSIDLYSFKEGSVIFPNEPVITVVGPLIECQLLETFILIHFNHQSLIATKATRIVNAAAGRSIMEFGARRAHGIHAATYGARAAYIGGVVGTSNLLADYMYSIPALGTMAHSFVQSYDSEFESFKAYALTYPDDCVLLIDTYDTLKSGIKNAIRIDKEILKPLNKKLKGVRIDSGDLAYLSQQCRWHLDANNMEYVKIIISNSLDEYAIQTLLVQGAKVDVFGIGERLITAKSEPVFGGVYKLAAIGKNKEQLEAKIKMSNNISKMTTPAFKQVYRLYDDANKAIADVITLHDEKINNDTSYHLFDPLYPWKEKMITNFKAIPRLEKILENGILAQPLPQLKEIRAHLDGELQTLWDEVKRLEKPHVYYVDLSQKLWDLKQELIRKCGSDA